MNANDGASQNLIPPDFIIAEDSAIAEAEGYPSGEITSPEDDEISVVGLQLDLTTKIYDYIQDGIELKSGDYCIIEMDKGIEIARVCRVPVKVSRKQYRKPLKKIIRKATPEDIEINTQNDQKGQKALSVCQKKIDERGLPMKLVRVRYSFDGSKAVFYFTAEGRIDFRDLVKDLAARFKTRIEMRQIGVRDEARIISGYGCCGRPLCCSLFLRDFEPVSIRMAKDQCLTLNPGKISGICGRLMCCLVYEAELYEDMRKKLPKLGERVLVNNNNVPDEGKVVSLDVLKELIMVEFADGRVLKLKGTEVKRLKNEATRKSPKKSGKPDRSDRPDRSSDKPDRSDKSDGGNQQQVAKLGKVSEG